MAKVSFDFDGVLDRADVVLYVKTLVERGVDVYICTSRLSDEDCPSERWNDDLYQIVDILGISRSNIIFCSRIYKYQYFKHKDFLFHVDDSFDEVELINSYTNTVGVFLVDGWIDKCEQIINKNYGKTNS